MKKYSILFIASTLILSASCKKVLDKEPESSIREGDPQSVQGLLPAAYQALSPDSYYAIDYQSFGEVISDNCIAGGDQPDRTALQFFNYTPSNEFIGRSYAQMYVAISRANLVITTLQNPADDLSGAFVKDALGQGYFLRALTYFNLVRLFGGVPLYLQVVQSTNPDELNLPRSTADDVYAQIIKDLLAAEEGLASGPNSQKATKEAAQALLAKVYLTRKQYAQAAAYAEKVIISGKQQLMGAPQDLYPAKNKGESIFEIQYIKTIQGNPLNEFILPAPPASYGFIKFHIPTPDIVNAFTAGDKRKQAAMLYVPGSPNDPTHVGYFVNKWPSPGNAFSSGDNTYVLRLADVLLMRAEALNELEYTADGDAFTLLNVIRNRAGLGALTSTDLSNQGSFRTAVLKERRLELAFEGERWFDLLRTGRALQHIQDVTGNADANKLLFPIPKGERDKNPQLAQNPGY